MSIGRGKTRNLELPQIRLKRIVSAVASGALAIGALAVGALAIGALAIGRLSVRRVEARKVHFGEVEIDELNVKRLHVGETTTENGTECAKSTRRLSHCMSAFSPRQTSFTHRLMSAEFYEYTPQAA
jgi:hypothetical protein